MQMYNSDITCCIVVPSLIPRPHPACMYIASSSYNAQEVICAGVGFKSGADTKWLLKVARSSLGGG